MVNQNVLAKELEKLPKRKPRGHPDNILRAVAGGFVFMGYTAEVSLEKAKAVIGFYDEEIGGKHEQSH